MISPKLSGCLADVSINGLTRVPQEIDIWIIETFYNKFGTENDFTQYLKESCLLFSYFKFQITQVSNQIFFFK